jgi:parallel beta-helix repeat protein
MKLRILLISILLMMLMCGGVSADVGIPAGAIVSYNLGTNGEKYDLQGDVTATGNALIVGANNITLDGHGFNVTFATVTGGTGVSCTSHSNVTIKNTNFVTGAGAGIPVFLSGASFNTLENISTVSDSGHSIYIYASSNYNIIRNCTVYTSSGNGIYCRNSVYNNIINSTSFSISNMGLNFNNNSFSTVTNCNFSSSTQHGAYILNSNNNTFLKCTSLGIAKYGFYLSGSSSNTISNCVGITNGGSAGVGFDLASNYNSMEGSIGTATSSGNGVFISSSNSNAITDCIGDSSSGKGLYIYLSNNSNVTNGRFSSNSSYGFDYYRSYIGRFDSCTFTSNYSNPVFIHASGNDNFSNITVISQIASAPHSNSHILAIGDSITAGGAQNIVPLGAYTPYEQAALNNISAGWFVSNAGVSGETAAGMRYRFIDELDIFNPRIVTIEAGTNDISTGRIQQDTIDDILWMATTARDRGVDPYIILTTPTQYNNNLRKALVDNLTIQAAALNIKTLKIYDAVDTTPDDGIFDNWNTTNFVDDTHPNDFGNSLIGAHLALHISYSLIPVANFTMSQSNGYAPMTVQFTDVSYADPTSWLWDFGDGTTSTEQNPTHIYNSAGPRTIRLTATNAFGNNTTTVAITIPSQADSIISDTVISLITTLALVAILPIIVVSVVLVRAIRRQEIGEMSGAISVCVVAFVMLIVGVAVAAQFLNI